DARPGRYVVLTMRDTGVGMTSEVLAHVFEPFFTTKPQGAGTGLGLATVYGIVEQSGGFVSIASEVGKGTVFDVHFPAVAGAITPTGASEPGATAYGGETILIVEDDDAVRSMTRRALE